MTSPELHPAVQRILREHSNTDLIEVLSDQLSGADFTALMLEVMRRRAAKLKPADVMAQYRRDRFVQPAFADACRLLELELLALRAASPRFESVVLAPLVPLGTHSVIAGVHQNRIVTTMRGTEVAADPTNALALEAARRRRGVGSSGGAKVVHLAAVERVVRAQHFEGSRSFPHFSVLGLVSAGRDVGTKVFERESMESHLDALLAICHAAGFPEVEVKLTDFGGRHQMVIDELIASMSRDALTVVEWPDRTAAQGYYPSLCFKISVTTAEGPVEIGDGGLVRWTEALVASRKERLMISGLSIERLALVTAPTSSH